MKIDIRYCAMCGYGPKAVNLAALILEQFRRKLESVTLTPDAGGCFEVTFDSELYYSKLATDEFPDERAVLDELAVRLAGRKG